MQKYTSLYNSQLMLSTFLPFYLLPPVTKFRGVFGGRKLFLPGHSGLIFDGRIETCFYCEVSYGPLVSCVIGGVTESHRHSAAIATGAERRGFVTNRGRDWSVATKNLEVTGSHGKGRNVFLPSHSHTPIETKMRQGKKVER